MTLMTRRSVVVAAWLWAIVVMLWAGRASYAVVRSLGPDVVFGALMLVAVAAAAIQLAARPVGAYSCRHRQGVDRVLTYAAETFTPTLITPR